MKKIIFEQNNYGNLEIDNTEKDVLLIWDVSPSASDRQVIFIQRELIDKFIEALRSSKKKFEIERNRKTENTNESK